MKKIVLNSILVMMVVPLLLCTGEFPLNESQTSAPENSNSTGTTASASTTPSGDTTVWTGEVVLPSSKTIPAGQTYWCAPGTQLSLPASSILSVMGTLIISGTSASPVQIFCPSGTSITISGKLIATYLGSQGTGGSFLTGAGGSIILENVTINGYTNAINGYYSSISISNGTFTGNATAISLANPTGTSSSTTSLTSMTIYGAEINGSGRQTGTGISIDNTVTASGTVLLQQVLFDDLNNAIVYSINTAGVHFSAINTTIENCNNGFSPLTTQAAGFDTVVFSNVDISTQNTALPVDSALGVNQFILENANVASQTATPAKIQGSTISLQFNHVALLDKTGIPYTPSQVYKNVADSTKFTTLVLDSVEPSGRGAGYAYVSVIPANLTSGLAASTVPQTPAILSDTSGNGSVALYWTPVDGALSYNIYYAAGTTVDQSGAKINVSSSPKIVSGLANGTQYAFAVSAVNLIGESSLSSVVTATPLSAPVAPTITSVTDSSGQVTLSWGAVALATSYNIYYAAGSTVDKTGAKFTVTGSSSGSSTGGGASSGSSSSGGSSGGSSSSASSSTFSKTIKGLTNGTQYAFVVTSVNGIGESNLSAVVTSTPYAPLTAPAISQVAAGDDSVIISWGTVNGAVSYNIYYAAGSTVDSKNGSKVSVTTSPKTITGLSDGTQYAFAMSSVNGGGNESSLGAVSTATPEAPSAAPVITGAKAGNDSVTVTWSSVPGATSYNLYYETGVSVDKNAAAMFSGVTSPKTIRGLANGVEYAFAVTAVNGTGESNLSSAATAVPLANPSAPSITLVSGDSSITVSWSGVAFASSYNLYYASGGSVDTNGYPMKNVTSPTTIAGLTNGIQYAVAVSAVNSQGQSILSAVQTATPSPGPGAPGNVVAADSGTDTVIVTWDPVAGANSYNLYYGTGTVSKSSSKLTNVTSPQTVPKLTGGTAYQFAVSAVNENGESSLSTAATATPVAPAGGKSGG